MSADYYGLVLSGSRTQGTARLVMLALGDSAWENGVARASIYHLARYANTSFDEVVTHLQDLVASGEVSIKGTRTMERPLFPDEIAVQINGEQLLQQMIERQEREQAEAEEQVAP